MKLASSMLEHRRPGYFSAFGRSVRDGTVRYCITQDEHPTDLAESFRSFSTSNSAVVDPARPAFLGASFEGFRPLFRVGPHTVYESPQNGNRAGSSESGRRSP